MSKMEDMIRGFIEAGSKLMILLPGDGYVLGRLESIIDDVVTIVPDGRPKIMLHYTQVVVRL